jgi:arylsulfatase A-like enzyme
MTRERPPNLLFLITDQQRADTVQPGSPCLTPNLEALARGGVRFDRCYAPNPICSPTRASLFTGLLPHSHGVTDVTHAVPAPAAELRPDLPLWSQALAKAGYRGGYFGKWHVERSDRLERFGFDEYEVDLRLVGVKEHRGRLSPRVALSHPGYRELLLAGVSDEPPEATREHYLFGRGIDFIRDAAATPEQPWALVVSTEAPHDPYIAPREQYRRYDPASLPKPASFGDPMADKPSIYRRIRDTWRDLSWEEYAQATACYYALCSLIDDEVGRILAALRDTGQEQDTLVVFTSDHGDYLGAHGLMLKGVPAFEEAYRAPLIMNGPGLPEGLTVDSPVSLLDLPRTLLSLLTGDPFPCQGRDLAGYLQGREPAPEPEAFAEFHGQRLGYTQRILWRDRVKYVYNGFDFDELYDLAADPFELRNLAADRDHAPVLREMASRLWEIVRETGDDTLAEAQYGMFRFAPVGPEPATGKDER